MAEFYDWAEDDWAEDAEAVELLADVLGPETPEVSEEFADLAELLELVESRKGWVA